MKDSFLPNIVDIGGCSLHHIHNAASHAVEQSDMGVEELVKDIYYHFKYSGPEQERFSKVSYSSIKWFT